MFLATSRVCFSMDHSPEDNGIALECHSTAIIVRIPKSFLSENEVYCDNAGDIFFYGNHTNCASVDDGDDYVLSIYPPFNTCGTTVNHSAAAYDYTNEVVYAPSNPDSAIDRSVSLLKLKCSFPDEYVVVSADSDGDPSGLQPLVRTMYEKKGKGNITVSMSMYRNDDYTPASRLGPMPLLMIGAPVYISVDMVSIFAGPNFVITMEECYASTSPSPTDMDTYYNLVTNRCVNPEDETIRIITNGIGDSSRFKFNMFRWKDSIKRVYLHCSVSICNTTSAACTGSGSGCNGVEGRRYKREDREVVSEVYFDDQNSTFSFVSVGPLTYMTQDQMKFMSDGESEVVTRFNNKNNKKRQEFPTAYVFGGIGIIFILAALGVLMRFCCIMQSGASAFQQKGDVPKGVFA